MVSGSEVGLSLISMLHGCGVSFTVSIHRSSFCICIADCSIVVCGPLYVASYFLSRARGRQAARGQGPGHSRMEWIKMVQYSIK